MKTGNEVLRDPGNDKKMRIAYVHSVSGIRESDKTVSGIRDRNPPMRPPIYTVQFKSTNSPTPYTEENVGATPTNSDIPPKMLGGIWE